MKLPPRNISTEENKIEPRIETLLIDGNSLFKKSFHGAKNEFNSNGEHVGGIYGFLIKLRQIVNTGNYTRIYVFWDGSQSGRLRYEYYKDYKAQRGKDYESGYKELTKEERLAKWISLTPEEKSFSKQLGKVKDYLDQLFVRQLSHWQVEADDFIAYYCLNKGENEDITIVTGDRDYCQLIDDNISIFFLDLNRLINNVTFNNNFEYHLDNALLLNILLGDDSDNVKGVKRLGEKTLYETFPELKTRKVELTEIIEKSKFINEDRKNNKLKPLAVLTNIEKGITDGCHAGSLYETNKKIMDLKNPLLTPQAIEDFDNITQSPLGVESRDLKNILFLFKRDGISKMYDDKNFVNFITPFSRIMEIEKAFYYKWIKENE